MKSELKGLMVVLALVSVACGAAVEEQTAVDAQQVATIAQSVTNGACNTSSSGRFCLDSTQYASCAAQSAAYGCEYTNLTCPSRVGCAPYYICRDLRAGDQWYPSWTYCCDSADQSQSYWKSADGSGNGWYSTSCAGWGVQGP